MSEFSLEDIIPEKPAFRLKEGGKEYHLRIFNLEDRVWAKNRFQSDEEIQRIFQDQDWEKLTLMVYRLLQEKSDFPPSEEQGHDDDGREITRFVSGPERLRREISGVDTGRKVIGALAAAILAGNPTVKDYVKSELKKKMGITAEPKATEAKAPKKKTEPTGQRSMTRSQASTDSRRASSAS
jgi:hypothetical protein